MPFIPLTPSTVVNYIYTNSDSDLVQVVYDEDFWQVPVIPATPRLVTAITDDGEMPIRSMAEEDSYQPPVFKPVVNKVLDIWSYEPNDLVTLFVDEDYSWLVVPRTQYPVPSVITDEGEIVIDGNGDEDYYALPVPSQSTFNASYKWLEQGESVFLASEEDYCWWFAAKQQAVVPQAIVDEGEFTRVGSGDEDNWAIARPALQPQQPQPVSDQGDGVFLAAEEDYWWAWLVRSQSIYVPPVTDESEITITGKVDEDHYQIVLPQVTLNNRFVYYDEGEATLAFGKDEDYCWFIPATSPQRLPSVTVDEGEFTLFSNLDEDYWVAPRPWVQVSPTQPVNDPADSVWLAAEEDYWQIWVGKQQGSFIQPITDEGEITTVGKVDEDYYQLVLPCYITVNRLQYADEGEATFGIRGDEDSWWTASPQRLNSIVVPVQDEGEFTLFASVDEDYWQVVVLQPSVVTRLLYADEGESSFPIRGDEDYYWVGLVQTQVRVPTAITDEGEFVLFAVVDEDFNVATKQQQAGITPVINYDQGDSTWFGADEDYWINVVPQKYPSSWLIVLEDDVITPAVPEEDYYWVGSIAPVVAILPKQWQHDQHEQAAGLYGIYDEDFWGVTVPVFTSSSRLYLVDNEEARPIILIPDDDLWILTLSMPRAAVNNNKMQFNDATETLGYAIRYITRMNDWLDLAALHRSVT